MVKQFSVFFIKIRDINNDRIRCKQWLVVDRWWVFGIIYCSANPFFIIIQLSLWLQKQITTTMFQLICTTNRITAEYWCNNCCCIEWFKYIIIPFEYCIPQCLRQHEYILFTFSTFVIIQHAGTFQYVFTKVQLYEACLLWRKH